jgi:hypothetical protein
MGSPANYEPRFEPLFNQVYQAIGYTFVMVWFEGGHTTPVELLVGDEYPPTQSLGVLRAESGNASGVVRPGEYWALRCKRDSGGGFRAMATPMHERVEDPTV